MTQTEALKLALEALQDAARHLHPAPKQNSAITAIKEALAQPEQEPVAITITGKLGNIYSFTGDYSLKKGDKVYTTPPQRKPLTDEQIAHATAPVFMGGKPSLTGIARAIEAAHGIKENA